MEVRKGESSTYVFDLGFEEREDVKGWSSFELASTVTSDSIARGSTTATAYSLQPINWLKQAMEAAKELMVYQTLARQEVCPNGVSQLVIPKMTKQMAAGDWETSAAEYTTANTDIAFTDITNLDGVFFAPNDASYGIAITNKALRKSALNLPQNYQDQLNYRMAYVIDDAVRSAITPASGGSATEMSNSAAGVQTIFGGDATTAANSLDAGDVMTPALIKKANRLLKSKVGYYWTADTFTASSTGKNPWTNDKQGPFYGLISAESEEALLNSSQFTNAAEFGTDDVIKTGSIAKYSGTTLVETTMTAAIAAGGTAYVQGATTSVDVAAHENMFFKANYMAGLVWGEKPKMYVFDYPSQLQKRMVIEMAYQAKPLYDDATVRVITSDE